MSPSERRLAHSSPRAGVPLDNSVVGGSFEGFTRRKGSLDEVMKGPIEVLVKKHNLQLLKVQPQNARDQVQVQIVR